MTPDEPSSAAPDEPTSASPRPGRGGTSTAGTRRPLRAAPLLAAALLLAAGCATAGSTISQTRFGRADLAQLEDNYSTVYQFLKAHGRVKIVRPDGLRSGEEKLFVYQRGISSINVPGASESALYVNNREVPDPVPYLRNLSLSDVQTLEVLRATEASARHGGDGRQGMVSITLVP